MNVTLTHILPDNKTNSSEANTWSIDNNNKQQVILFTH